MQTFRVNEFDFKIKRKIKFAYMVFNRYKFNLQKTQFIGNFIENSIE
jgi:hypothetical protein